MSWKCSSCRFPSNPNEIDNCIACGTKNENSKSGEKILLLDFMLNVNQKLGVKLKPPKNGVIQDGLYVESVDKKAAKMNNNKIQPGDLISCIGEYKIDGLGFSKAVELIRTLPRPLKVTYQVVESRRKKASMVSRNSENDLDTDSYAAVFDAGPMGLNLEDASRVGVMGTMVKALKGQAEEIGSISVGDFVSKVNDVEVLFTPHGKVMETIRESMPPRTLYFVPKDKLDDIQRMNSRQSEVFLSSSKRNKPSKYENSMRMVKDDGGPDDQTSIKELIFKNRAATIKKGGMFKQGSLVKNWKARYFVLSVSKLEYFKNPTATSSRGEVQFLSNRCTVRDLAPSEDVVSKNPIIKATFLIEVRAGDRKLILACSSMDSKKSWLDALKLAMDASKTMSETNSESKSLSAAKSIRDLDTAKSDFAIVNVTVLSATSLTKVGSTVNAYCEITLDSETFKSSTVKSQRSPVWEQDNCASFEVFAENANLEVRVFDEHTFRSTDLISTLTIPVHSLPNKQAVNKTFPLVLSNRATGAQLELLLEYINEDKPDSNEESFSGQDFARASMLMDREEMKKIQKEAQEAADEAAQIASKAEDDAAALLNEAQRKADMALAAAEEKAAKGQVEIDTARAEAEEAKREADRQVEEAKRAQEEARALIEANQHVQDKTNIELERQAAGKFDFNIYRRMLIENVPQDQVKRKMREDGVEEVNVDAFFEGIISYDQKVKELQAKVAALSRKEKQAPKADPYAELLANSEISQDQEKLLRRLLKLEKQLQQAGLSIAEDIPYEEAKAKVQEISQRMQEIGTADVVHDDLAIQQQLREEYYKLEQDMEKFNTALMLSDEYTAEQERKEQEWEDLNRAENMEALMQIRRCMPVNIKSLSEAQLESLTTPNGKRIPSTIARKFKRSNVLELLRIDPNDIYKMHPSLLENLRVTGLSVTERRALHVHLSEIAGRWQELKQDEIAGRKWTFFSSLLKSFKPMVNMYNRHVEMYGPPGNHVYATKDDMETGCPKIGRQCEVKANSIPDYTNDLGYPAGDEYMESTVQKSDPEDAGAKALREAKELSRAKASNARSNDLKRHYKGNVRESAKAGGVCDDIDATIDKIENTQRLWVQARLSDKKLDPRAESSEFNEMISMCRLACITYTERSGMKLSGKRDTSADESDPRSAIEILLCEDFCMVVKDCLAGILQRMDRIKSKEKRARSAVPILEESIEDIHNRNLATLNTLTVSSNKKNKKRILLADLIKEVELAKKEDPPAEEASSPTSTAGPGRGGPGRGGPGRGGDFLSAIRGRGRGPSTAGLLGAIRGRGSGRGGPGRGAPGRGDLFAAIASRKKD